MRRAPAVFVICVVACAESERTSPELEEVRVSTHRGLDPIVPPSGQSTSVALQDLVCPSVEREFDLRKIDATTFELKRKPATSRPLDELSRELRHRDLVSVTVENDSLRATVKPNAIPEQFCLEDGDYRVASYAPTQLLLERTRGTGIRRIRTLAFRDSEEEWRRFLAREVDVVPGANKSQLRYLRALPSVKLVPVALNPATGLTFNTARVSLELRRAVALAIHRKAVVRSLGYDDSMASPGQEDADAAARMVADQTVPSPFRVLAVVGEAEMRRAALVLEANLQRAGIPFAFELMDTDAIFDRMKKGEYEALLFFVGFSKPSMWRLYRSGDPINFSHYANPEYDAAIDAGDAIRVRDIIARDFLEVPIYRIPDVVAADARLCGIKPNLVDLSWLGDVHMCAPGETE
ncbi:MAG TPA: ABC transporter substrate-binding protein [Haliangiales bacterium]|nr:ABC transporter substrate-binding protein [Haliangiales bacterium]